MNTPRRNRLFLWFALLASSVSLTWYGLTAEADGPSTSAAQEMQLPEYDQDGRLLRPDGYERWMMVGTSVGLSYSSNAPSDRKNPGQFHNVFMQPQAFDHFVRTGEFAEQTIFVVTNQPSQATAGQDDLNREGFFATPVTGLEVSVKDSKRFADGWAYYMFHGDPHAPAARPAEAAFERADCLDCHAEHGRTDHVFTQFYSVLTAARERELQKKKAD